MRWICTWTIRQSATIRAGPGSERGGFVFHTRGEHGNTIEAWTHETNTGNLGPKAAGKFGSGA